MKLFFYPFTVGVNRYVGSCNTIDETSLDDKKEACEKIQKIFGKTRVNLPRLKCSIRVN